MNRTVYVREFSTYLTRGNSDDNPSRFMQEFLPELDKDSWWNDPLSKISLDFEGVEIIDPWWAQDFFGYYCSHWGKAKVLEKLELVNLTPVKKSIIMYEINLWHADTIPSPCIEFVKILPESLRELCSRFYHAGFMDGMVNEHVPISVIARVERFNSLYQEVIDESPEIKDKSSQNLRNYSKLSN